MNPVWSQWIIEPPLAIDLLARATLVLALGWLVHRALWRANPRWRVVLWRGVAIGLVALPVATLLMPPLRIAVVQPPPPAAGAPVDGSASSETRLPVEGAPVGASTRIELGAPSASEPAATVRRPNKKAGFRDLGIGVWTAVFALLLIRMWLATRRIERIVRNSRPAPARLSEECRRISLALGCRLPVEVRRVAGLSTPLLTGLRRPVLLLPDAVCGSAFESELTAILVHELSHLRTNDLLWNTLFGWISTVLWFHPLAWRISEAHISACECVSDAVSAEYVGDVGAYARTLARVAIELVACPPGVGGIPMARVSEIQNRLELLKRRVFVEPLRRRAVAVVFLCAILPFGAVGAVSFDYARSGTSGRRRPETRKGMTAVSPSEWTRAVRVSAPQGNAEVTRTLKIWQWGGAVKYDIAVTPDDWVRIVPSSGESSGGVNEHKVVFTTDGLAPGIHKAIITIQSDAQNGDQTIPVELTVTPDISTPAGGSKGG